MEATIHVKVRISHKEHANCIMDDIIRTVSERTPIYWVSKPKYNQKPFINDITESEE